MTREDVKKRIPGITDESLAWLLDTTGAELTREKAKADALQKQLDTANFTITELRDAAKQYDGVDVAGLQKQIADGKAKYDQDIADLRRDHAIDLALTARRVRNLKAARALLDLDKIQPGKDGQYTGITEQLDALEQSDGYLFPAAEKPGTGVTVSTGGEHGTNGDRCLRQKQGAVSGAALRFLQAPAVVRSKNRLSARGNGGDAGPADGVAAAFASLNPDLKL